MEKGLRNLIFKLIGSVIAVAVFILCMSCVLTKNNTIGDKTSKSIIKNYENENCLPQNYTESSSGDGIKLNVVGNETQNKPEENIKFSNHASVTRAGLKEVETSSVITSKGGVVIEASSGRVLVNENMNARCFPASTTKVLTALVVLEKSKLDKKVKIPKAAVGVEGSSIYLREGEVLTVEELLYGLMLRSGNDAAVALAIDTAGDIASFAGLMNAKAKECGAMDSNFINPNGLHDDMHYSTPHDLAVITAQAFKNNDFCRIVNTKSVKISGIEGDRYIANKNKLLSMYDGANGVKTGYTKKSGRCLVGAAKRNNMQLISVVLNYSDMWNDTMRMLNKSFDTYFMCPLEKAMLYGNENAKTIELDYSFNDNGGFVPYSYPIKKDGSEKIILQQHTMISKPASTIVLQAA